MADYYVDLSGNVTQGKKKRKKADYHVSLDGTVTKNFQEPKTTVSKNDMTPVEAKTTVEMPSRPNSMLGKQMSNSYDAIEQIAGREVASSKGTVRGSEFDGLTNKGYKEYLDNLQSNATDEKQNKWLQEQRENLIAMQDKSVRNYLSVMLPFYQNAENKAAHKSYAEAKAKMKKLGYTDKQINSLLDTYDRETNAKHNESMMERVDKLTNKGIGGKVAAQVLGIGAGLESAFGGLESIGATANEKLFANYKPLDTNKQAFTAGDFKERVSGNIQKDIEGEEPNVVRKGLGVLYQGATGAADSFTTAMAFGPAAPIVMAAQAVGNSNKDAFERTGSNTKATATGIASGVIEYGTEKMGLDNLWDIIKGSGKAATRSTLANILAQSGIEGMEEATSEALGTVADWIINKADSNLQQNVQRYKEDGKSDKEAWTAAALDALKEVGQAGLIGAISGGISGSAASALGMDTFSKNENKVIDKEVENRISEREKDGTKLKAKEKAEIRKEVEQALKDGDISIDTIESALGGQTFAEFKSYNDQKKALEDEIENFRKMPMSEFTVADSERLRDARKELVDLKQNTNEKQLRERLSKEVSDRTLSDSYIRESYNEKGRRSQAFEADLSKYDKRQQATIQKAIDSGILNNTNKTHKFVDLLAKISADKGVSFDFTDNARIKESGFAVQGATVNGYVKDGNVTLNINSAKALNSVVGHEITHVLEGTEHYAALQEAVFEYAKTKKDYDGRLKTLTELYKNVENADVNKELTADLIGDYLFTDEKFVQQLSTQNRNVFQKIYDEIKYLVKTVTSGSKEAKQLEKVKKVFNEAYKETNTQKSNADNKRVQYDVSEDVELYRYIQDALDGKVSQKSYYKITDAISERLANDIEKIVGFSVEGYENKISSNHIQHISDRHGVEGKADQSMKDMHDLAKIGFIIENYDNIREGEQNYQYRNKDNSYAKTVVLQKKIDDGFYYVVEAVPDAKAKTLYVVSAYQNKNDTFSEEGVQKALNPNAQNELQFNASSNNSIPQGQRNTTEKQKNSLDKDSEGTQLSKTQVDNMSLSDNNDIAPIGNWNVKGKDLALEGVPIRQDIAPAQQQDAAGDDIAPWTGEDDLSEGMFSPPEESTEQQAEQQEAAISKRNAEKIKNIQVNIKGLQMSRDITEKEFDTSIAAKTSEYENLQRKDTKRAAQLLTQIENLKYRKENALAEVDRKIQQQREAIEKIKEQEIARQRKRKQNELQQRARELLGDTSKWKDKKWGLQYQVNTFRRNLMDIIKDEDGNPDYDKAEMLYDALQGSYNRNEAKLNREGNSLKDKFREMKINKRESSYIQMLGEYKYNPDCTLTAEVMHEYYEKYKNEIDTNKVDKAIELARKDYDTLYQRVNVVLREHGFKEIPYREGYFPHFTKEAGKMAQFFEKVFNWKTQNNEIPTDIAGLTEMFTPNRSYQSFDKHRTGDNTTYDFLKGYDTYVDGALDWIYHIGDIQFRRAVENEIRYQHSEKGVQKEIDKIKNNPFLNADQVQEEIDKVLEKAKNPLNHFVQDLRKGTQMLAGKKDTADRNLEEKTSRQVYSTMTNISNRVTANMVVGSVSAASTNLIPITRSWSQVSPVSSLKAMPETIKSYIVDDGTIDKSDFLTNRLRKNQSLTVTGWDKVGEKLGFLMEAVDNFSSQTVWRSKYMENIEKGMSEAEAIKNADQFAENVIAGRSRGNMPTIFNEKNIVTKMITAFQLEVANDYGYMFKDMPRDLQNETKGKLVKNYVSMYVGAYVFAALSLKLTGRNGTLNPIGILEELLKDLFGDDEEEGDVAKALSNLATNIAEEIPFIGGLLGGGRIPISSALPYNGLTVDSFSEVVSDISEGEWDKFWKEMMNPLYYVAMPMGGGQLRKTIQGLSMFDDDLPVAGSYTDSGKLRFPVEKTPANVAQAAVFGQYASENARDYFENNRSPLKDKQLEEFLESKLPIKEYWDYREGLKGKTKLEEKADYIASLDIPISAKNVLINNQSSGEEEIDLTDYDLYETFEEFDFATKNPGKYAISKAVGGYKTYNKYTKTINGIKGNKDSSGNTISGSRKQKVENYIKGLEIEDGEKMILLKKEYPSDDKYNGEILEHLSSRNDISYQDKIAILKELGFTVDEDGTVRW